MTTAVLTRPVATVTRVCGRRIVKAGGCLACGCTCCCSYEPAVAGTGVRS